MDVSGDEGVGIERNAPDAAADELQFGDDPVDPDATTPRGDVEPTRPTGYPEAVGEKLHAGFFEKGPNSAPDGGAEPGRGFFSRRVQTQSDSGPSCRLQFSRRF